MDQVQLLRRYSAGAIAALFVFLLAPVAAYAGQLTIEFETFGEPPPAQLCVLAKSLDEGKSYSACESAPERCGLPAGLSLGVPQNHCFEFKVPKDRSLLCTHAPGGSSSSIAVLELGGVGIGKFVLTGRTALVNFNPIRQGSDKGNPPSIALVGGHYHASDAVAFPLDGRNQWAKLSLHPRCVERELSLPNFACETSAASNLPVKLKFFKNTHGSSLTNEEQEKANEMSTGSTCELSGSGDINTCTVPLGQEGKMVVVAKACEHEFRATGQEPVPPERIELAAQKFWFLWARSCLSPKGSCPVSQWMSADVRCTDSPAKSCTKSSPKKIDEQLFCKYECKGSSNFPANIRLTPGDSVSQHWTELLNFPGQVLFGFTPAERRQIPIHWTWPDLLISELPDDPEECKTCRENTCGGKKKKKACAEENLKLISDEGGGYLDKKACEICADKLREKRENAYGREIDYLEIRSPEGRVHHVGMTTKRISVPEFDCDDQLTITYVGRQSYRQAHPQFRQNTGVDIKSPNDLSNSDGLVALSVGGGIRYLRHQESSLSPQVEAELIYVVTPNGWRGPWSLTSKLEVRAGAVLVNQPYCSEYARTGDGDSDVSCADHLEQVLYWRFLVEPGLTFFLSPKWRLESSVGLAIPSYFWLHDSDKLPSRPQGTIRGAVGYELVRGVTVMLQYRLLVPEYTFATKFDASGLSRSGEDGETHSSGHLFGLTVRFDDLL